MLVNLLRLVGVIKTKEGQLPFHYHPITGYFNWQ